jgi:ABC-type bacteriocin/lantibiotic exporter with double-glycine peptidase domain
MPMMLAHPFWRPLRFPAQAYRDVAMTSIFMNLLAIALPVFTRVVYDRVVPNFAEDTLWVLFSGMMLVLVCEVLFKTSRNWITDTLGTRAAGILEQDFLKHILHLPHGTNMAKMSYYLGNLQDVREFFCSKLLPTLVDLPFVLAFLLIIYLTCPAITLVPVTIGIVIIGLQYLFHVTLNQTLLGNQQAIEKKMHALSETLNGRDTIRQLARYAPFLKRWEEVVGQSADQGARMMFWHHLVGALCQAFVVLNSILLVVVGVYEIHNNALSVGGLIAVNLLSARVLAPLVNMGELFAKWPKVRKEMQAIEKILGLPAENALGKENIILKGGGTLEDATVLLGNYPALKNTNLRLAAAEKLALVGASGAGKSTLLKVLSMETPLTMGKLCWDDYDSLALSPTALRGQLGIVEQHPYFFAGTVRDNLLNGEALDDDALMQMLEVVALDAFIKAAGRGLDLPLSEGGLNISGGQRQALAIARALLRRPKVLLMDEPTAMMDHVMEQRLVQNLRIALQGITVVLVTHRTPLLSLVDTMAIMENGSIIKHGARQTMLEGLSHATA